MCNPPVEDINGRFQGGRVKFAGFQGEGGGPIPKIENSRRCYDKIDWKSNFKRNDIFNMGKGDFFFLQSPILSVPRGFFKVKSNITSVCLDDDTERYS